MLAFRLLGMAILLVATAIKRSTISTCNFVTNGCLVIMGDDREESCGEIMVFLV